MCQPFQPLVPTKQLEHFDKGWGIQAMEQCNHESLFSTKIEGPVGVYRSSANSQSRELLSQNRISLVEFTRKWVGHILLVSKGIGVYKYIFVW